MSVSREGAYAPKLFAGRIAVVAAAATIGMLGAGATATAAPGTGSAEAATGSATGSAGALTGSASGLTGSAAGAANAGAATGALAYLAWQNSHMLTGLIQVLLTPRG
ncbi:hypothetical protein ACWEVD_29190 [Nocardia thailandica]|uniref:Uncharacterized protein n=1 Tax=Nocardia thailandica TaxID=257275 RepID=A0ABW6PKB7_9NOCA|nr:hypothetical protein [Nocardia thailandica]